MYILGLCDNGDVLATFKIINIVIKLIKIFVPIVLIVSVMIDYFKAVLNHEELNMTSKIFVNKIAAALIVFLVPTLVNITIDLVDPNSVSYAGCLKNATTENIDAAYAKTTENYISQAKKSLLYSDYTIAKSSISKIKSEKLREPLKKEIEDLEPYVRLYEAIDSVANNYNSKRYAELKEEIDSVSDKNIKKKLTDKLKATFKSKSSLAEFDRDPNSKLYSNLKPLTGITLKEVLKKNGSSVEELNRKIQTAVENAGVGTRKAVAIAGMTLIDELSHMGYYMFYDWGGKWFNVGVDGNWGSRINPPYCSSYDDPSYCLNTFIWKGFDCSGFADWAIIQGFQSTDSKYRYNNSSSYSTKSLSSSNAVCDIGDTLNSATHVVLVIGIDDANKRYLIEESTTGSANRLRISYKSFNEPGYVCYKYNFYKN